LVQHFFSGSPFPSFLRPPSIRVVYGIIDLWRSSGLIILFVLLGQKSGSATLICLFLFASVAWGTVKDEQICAGLVVVQAGAGAVFSSCFFFYFSEPVIPHLMRFIYSSVVFFSLLLGNSCSPTPPVSDNRHPQPCLTKETPPPV